MGISYYIMMRKIASVLLTGSTVVVKVSEYTPITSFEIAKMLNDAGVPPGVVNVVTEENGTVGQALVESNVPEIIFYDLKRGCGPIDNESGIRKSYQGQPGTGRESSCCRNG